MDLRTESLDFNAFQLFICLFLTADKPPHNEEYGETYPQERSISHHSFSPSEILNPLPE